MINVYTSIDSHYQGLKENLHTYNKIKMKMYSYKMMFEIGQIARDILVKIIVVQFRFEHTI